MTIDLAHPYYNTSGTAQYTNAREVGFGADPETRARFAIVGWNEWNQEITYGSRKIPGTKRTKTQITHQGNPEVEYEIRITLQNAARLQALQGTISDLILPYGSTIWGDEEYDVPHPDEWQERYIVMHNVLLRRVFTGRNFEEFRVTTNIHLEKVVW